CPSTTNNVVINALPNISNLPSNNDICVNETHTLSPASGGTWISSNNSIATITNGGVITGVSPGNATFTFTNTATGCSAISASIDVLDIPVITSVTSSNDPVCAGDASILTTIVQGAGGNNETIVNYNFNSGSNYGNLNGQNATGINSIVTGSINYDRPTNQGTTTTPGAFTQNNVAGGALRQIDDWEDDDYGWTGGTDDSGNWRFAVNGPNLPNYQTFRVYFQARRVTGLGNNKRIRVDYRVNGGTWQPNLAILQLPAGNSNWIPLSFLLPPGANNPNDLEFRLRVNDGSDFDYFWFFGYYVYNEAEPDVLIDNFQVQATTSGSSFDYSWTANPPGPTAGLPTGATVLDPNNDQITVNPLVTTDYTVTVVNPADGCPATETVTINVFPVPTLSIAADYCPAPPNENTVQL